MDFKARLLTVVLLLSTLSNSFAQVDDNERFVLLQYGYFSEDDCIKIQDSIDAKWKIYHKWVAGCLVTDELVDSVRIFNENTKERLANAYGDDWADRYSRELDEACSKHTIALKQALIDTLHRAGNGYTERIINNPDFTSLYVQIIKEVESMEKHQSISINNLQDESNTILYRGFANQFEINLLPSIIQDYHLECINCTIRTNYFGDSLPTGNYVIKPTGRENPILNIYSHKDLLKSHQFEAKNLPDPILFLNNIPNGSSIPIEAFDSTMILDLRYSDDITLKSSFEVVKWEFALNGERLAWDFGNTIAIKHLRKLTNLRPKDQFTLICTVKGPDGILRKKAAAFVLK